MLRHTNPSTLEVAAAALVQRLGGRWHSRGAMCRCPAHEDRTPSLSVRVGHTSLLFKCFAGCTSSEILTAIRAMRFDVPVGSRERTIVPSTADNSGAQVARELWDQALPLAGTAGEAYLASRLITAFSQALRWHPRTPLGRGHEVRFLPAIIAAVQDIDGVVAIQRLFVDPATAHLARDLPKPKLTLGRPLTGAVRLSGAGVTLGLAEGIENALSASILLGIPVWATLGAERLHQISMPCEVERVVLLADRDRAGRKAAHLARMTYSERDLDVVTLWPWHGLNDWNDVLREEGEGGGDGRGRQV